MNETKGIRQLLLVGAGLRVAVAMVIVLTLWLGFFWATGNLGAS